MGNLPSREMRPERRSSRRLSKPQTNTSSFSLLRSGSTKRQANANDNAPVLSDSSMMWKSPWTGDLLPKASPEIDESDKRRVRSLPSFSALNPRPSRPSISGKRRWSNLEEIRGRKHERSLSHSSSFVSRRLSKRQSAVHLADTKSRSQQSPIFYLPPSEVVDDVPESPGEDTRTGNVVTTETRRFSLIPRKSPPKQCVTTRTSRDSYRRPLSLIEQEDENMRGYPTPVSRSPRWPLYEPDELSLEYPVPSITHERAVSPMSLDYSHLGGLKRGSLRIVNGSASPAPSDRTHRGMHTHPNAESRGDNHSLEESKCGVGTPPDVTDKIMPFEQSSAQCAQASNTEDEHDIPGSPFSFEKSPTIAVVPRHAPFSGQGMEDEAINMAFDERMPDNGIIRKAPSPDNFSRHGRRESRSLTKDDSGYSSGSSVNSERADRTSRSANLSESPPQHSPPKASMEFARDCAQESVENRRSKSRRRSLRRKSKDANLRSTEQRQRKLLTPLLTMSTMCRESGNGKAKDRKTSHKPCCRRPGPPRFYAQLGPSSVPSVPASTTIQNSESDTEDNSEETAIEFSPARRRRFSTSSLKLGFRRNGFNESGTIYRSDGEEFIIENPHRRLRTQNDNDRRVNRSVDGRGRQMKSKSTSSWGSKVRSSSEPRIKVRLFSEEDEQASNRNLSPFRRRRQQRQQPFVTNDHDIPPVPSLPSMFQVDQMAQEMRQCEHEVDELPRGRARTRSIDQSRRRLMRAQRGYFAENLS
ncbi:hypothetical protein VTN96DRAFT_2997 [Rasamsonia emersonii]|uniref:Uncharacterized protein n=1 Tax=Rasamsonia emersonii (strain ATCC 16479 / CBS 393.64 / IMI 116815) TaxID=1408163 RepID=A0A0F4YS48_RASE3|nr:hypothetical protein T310_5328 [Rasamsonia emersonii CBS 393.64]KKA20651.1 hypothetical protein T310_5328 [Rasamsonia emersonii CBS 393.64]